MNRAQLGLYADRVCAPEAFDAQYRSDDGPTIDVRACSTMGLTRLIKDITGTELDKGQFVEMVPSLLRKVGRWPLRSTVEVPAPGAGEIIEANRVFGGSAGQKDVLWSEHPYAAAHVTRTGYSWVGFEPTPDSGYGVYEVLRGLLGQDELRRVGELAQARQGVQVIYGGVDTAPYIHEHATRDYNFETAWELDHRLPASLITAILPLGEYERSVLLNP